MSTPNVLKLTVLVVDDEPMIRRIAQISLESAGYAVAEAGSAAETRAAIENATSPFDLILLDLTLPDGEGTSMIPDIRQSSPGTRVLVCSGKGELAAGSESDGFLAKPFTRLSLLAAAQWVLSQPLR